MALPLQGSSKTILYMVIDSCRSSKHLQIWVSAYAVPFIAVSLQDEALIGGDQRMYNVKRVAQNIYSQSVSGWTKPSSHFTASYLEDFRILLLAEEVLWLT